MARDVKHSVGKCQVASEALQYYVWRKKSVNWLRDHVHTVEIVVLEKSTNERQARLEPKEY